MTDKDMMLEVIDILRSIIDHQNGLNRKLIQVVSWLGKIAYKGL